WARPIDERSRKVSSRKRDRIDIRVNLVERKSIAWTIVLPACRSSTQEQAGCKPLPRSVPWRVGSDPSPRGLFATPRTAAPPEISTRTDLLNGLFGLAFVGVAGVVFWAGRADTPMKPDAKEIERLVGQLVEGKSKEREEARRRLEAVGRAALPALR